MNNVLIDDRRIKVDFSQVCCDQHKADRATQTNIPHMVCAVKLITWPCCPRCPLQSVSHLWKQFRRFGRKGNADLAAEAEGHQRPTSDAGGLAWSWLRQAGPLPYQAAVTLQLHFAASSCHHTSSNCMACMSTLSHAPRPQARLAGLRSRIASCRWAGAVAVAAVMRAGAATA